MASSRTVRFLESLTNTNDRAMKIFQQIFNIGFDVKRNSVSRDKIFPVKVSKDRDGRAHLNREAFPPQVRAIWDYWMSSCHDNARDYEDRKNLWKDMDTIYYNAPILARAMKLIAAEVIQSDSNTQTIGVEAKEKQRKFILDFFDDIQLYGKLPSCALDIVQYGNAGWLLGFGDDGVDDVTQVKIYDFEDRIEFTPHTLRRELSDRGSLAYKMSSHQRVQALIDAIVNTEEYSSMFKSYLFGFQVGDLVIPPWRFLHFRNETTKSPFAPFGEPLLINSMAPYRQYDAAMSLQVAARGARFPIDKYELNLPGGLNPTDKLEKVIEFMNELDNSGIKDTKKEGIGIGERIITIKDLFDWDQIASNIDLGKMDDINMLREDLISSTGVPTSFLDPDRTGFGDSGVALAQQFKPFARLVNGVQTIMMENITQLVKIHMIQSGKFRLDEIDFQLTMPFPESQINKEIISSQRDLLDLADGIVNNLTGRILGPNSEVEAPIEMVRQVYHQVLPYDQARIDGWIDALVREREAAEKNAPALEDSQDAASFKFTERTKRNKNTLWKEMKYNQTSYKEKLKEAIFDVKQETQRDCSYGGKHYYSSKNKYRKFQAESLVEFDKKRIQLIKSNGSVKQYLKEETKYDFNQAKREQNGTATKTEEENSGTGSS